MQNALPPDAADEVLGITFFDLLAFGRWASGTADRDVGAFLQRFYEASADGLEPAGARLVKFMGDAGLAVFEPERTGDVVQALGALRLRVGELGEEAGFETDVVCKVHVGSVVTGTFGAGASRHFDVMGQSVCETALLRGPGLVLSASAYGRLGATTQAGFREDPESGVWRRA